MMHIHGIPTVYRNYTLVKLLVMSLLGGNAVFLFPL